MMSRFACLSAGSLSLRLGLVSGPFGPSLVLAPVQAPLFGGSNASSHGSTLLAAKIAAARVTLRLLATRGFPPTQAQNRFASQIFGFSPSLQSIRAAPNGSALLCALYNGRTRSRVAGTAPER